MSNWGKVTPVTKEVGGKTITFRSKLEYFWAVYSQLRKEQGIITDWLYESEEVKVKTKLGEIKIYRPDFTITLLCEKCKGEPPDNFNDPPCPDCDKGTVYTFEETKGWFTSKDYTKMKLFAEQYENPLTLIFTNLTNCKSARVQYGRAKRLEKLLESNGGRIIYQANKEIFQKIKHLFDV